MPFDLGRLTFTRTRQLASGLDGTVVNLRDVRSAS